MSDTTDPEISADSADTSAELSTDVEVQPDPASLVTEANEDLPDSEPQPSEREMPAWWIKARQYFPVAAFLGGFLFDSATLGRRVTTLDLFVVSGYAVLGFVFLALERKPWRELKHHRWVVNALQFVLGALFSAMTVLYFKSSGHLMAFVFVLSLFGFMVANEFIHKRGPTDGIVWSLYTMSLAMAVNFVVPFIFKSVSVIWFFLALAVALGAVTGLQRLTKSDRRTLHGPFAVAAFLALLHAFGGVPPVPLILKNNLVCTDYAKKDGEYTCQVDEPGIAQRFGADPIVTIENGQPAWCLTAVFAPNDVEVTMEHRWYKDTEDGWKKVATVDFKMKGGRKDGWRVYSRKRGITPGDWRVETALAGGAVLGYQDFEVREAEGEAAKTREAL